VDVLGKAVADLEASNDHLKDMVHQKVSDCLTNNALVQQTVTSLYSFVQRINQMEQRYLAMEQLLPTDTECFKMVRAFMHHQQATTSPQALTAPTSSPRLERLEQCLNTMQETIADKMDNAPSGLGSSPPLEILSTLKEEIKLLKQQIGGLDLYRSPGFPVI